MSPPAPSRTVVVSLAVATALIGTAGFAFAESEAAGPKPRTGKAAATAPGDLVRAERYTVYADPAKATEVPVDAWKVVYRSTSATGAAIDVSGSVLVPRRAWQGDGVRPVIGYAIGTHGLGDQCAPSYQLAEGTEQELGAMQSLLQQGWAVAVTDYEGLGTPGVHTYSVGRSQGRAVLDSVRAATRLPDAGLSADAPVGLWGYSQGGQSTGWAAQLAPAYAPELKVAGAAPGGVPADLSEVAEFLDGGPFTALVLAAGLGFDAAYPELDLENYLNDAGRAAMEDSKDDCVGDSHKHAFKRVSDYTTSNPLTTEAWRARLAENRLGGRAAPGVPVFLYHGAADEMVPYPQAARLRTEWCGGGATVFWSTVPGEHVSAYVEAVPAAVTWMRSRFAGTPAPDNCALP